jgi:hypothetical protein
MESVWELGPLAEQIPIIPVRIRGGEGVGAFVWGEGVEGGGNGVLEASRVRAAALRSSA